jgi:hypothetical protein
MLAQDLEETYRRQADDYALFQLSLLKNLKLRSDSNRARLADEIHSVRETLGFWVFGTWC